MGVAVRNEGSKVNANINVTPMVDVMLVLLIIFMVITPMLQNKVAVDMAKVDNPTSMPDADKIATSELGVKVRDKLADKPGKTIYVRADARAQFRAVEDAIDAVRTAGVDEVGLLTQKREGPGAAGGQ